MEQAALILYKDNDDGKYFTFMLSQKFIKDILEWNLKIKPSS
jgi:hypothetical protein